MRSLKNFLFIQSCVICVICERKKADERRPLATRFRLQRVINGMLIAFKKIDTFCIARCDAGGV